MYIPAGATKTGFGSADLYLVMHMDRKRYVLCCKRNEVYIHAVLPRLETRPRHLSAALKSTQAKR